MAYGDIKDLTRRTVFDEILCDKAFNIAKNSKFDKSQKGLASVIYKLSDKKTFDGAMKNKNMSNKELISRITQTSYHKIQEKKSTLIFYR